MDLDRPLIHPEISSQNPDAYEQFNASEAYVVLQAINDLLENGRLLTTIRSFKKPTSLLNA